MANNIDTNKLLEIFYNNLGGKKTKDLKDFIPNNTLRTGYLQQRKKLLPISFLRAVGSSPKSATQKQLEIYDKIINALSQEMGVNKMSFKTLNEKVLKPISDSIKIGRTELSGLATDLSEERLTKTLEDKTKQDKLTGNIEGFYKMVNKRNRGINSIIRGYSGLSSRKKKLKLEEKQNKIDKKLLKIEKKESAINFMSRVGESLDTAPKRDRDKYLKALQKWQLEAYKIYSSKSDVNYEEITQDFKKMTLKDLKKYTINPEKKKLENEKKKLQEENKILREEKNNLKEKDKQNIKKILTSAGLLTFLKKISNTISKYGELTYFEGQRGRLGDSLKDLITSKLNPLTSHEGVMSDIKGLQRQEEDWALTGQVNPWLSAFGFTNPNDPNIQKKLKDMYSNNPMKAIALSRRLGRENLLKNDVTIGAIAGAFKTTDTRNSNIFDELALGDDGLFLMGRNNNRPNNSQEITIKVEFDDDRLKESQREFTLNETKKIFENNMLRGRF